MSRAPLGERLLGRARARSLRSILLALVALVAVPTRAAHAIMVAAKHVDVELVADTASVAPGGTFRLGVRFLPEPHWHVYWQNPGDSGEAPRIAPSRAKRPKATDG